MRYLFFPYLSYPPSSDNESHEDSDFVLYFHTSFRSWYLLDLKQLLVNRTEPRNSYESIIYSRMQNYVALGSVSCS